VFAPNEEEKTSSLDKMEIITELAMNPQTQAVDSSSKAEAPELTETESMKTDTET
jgi:hypothetical protein